MNRDPRYYQDTDIPAARLWLRVDRSGGPHSCWLWQGSVGGPGYPQLRFRGRTIAGHRLSYAIANGPIPEGLCVLHSCDNPRCVNPEHLHLGTRADNAREASERGLLRSGDRHWNWRGGCRVA